MIRCDGMVLSLFLAGASVWAQEPALTPPASVAGELDGSPAESVGQVPAQGVAAAATARVARLTFMAGDVRLERTDNTDEGRVTPVINMPLTEGTRLVTGDYGQAEVEFEDGSVVRLTPRSALGLDSLALSGDVARSQVTLLGGLVYFELRKAAGSEYRIEAGGVEITPLSNVIVRASAVDAPATLAILDGEARIDRPEGFHLTVKSGESLRLDEKDESRYYLQSGVPEESWDTWNESRDRTAQDDASRQTSARDSYAGAQGYGWADLDANGSWYQVEGQGQVWQPDVADEGFDPYGFGAWVWSGGGYAWASGYGWGWTPFRCGRWTYLKSFGWGWIPDAGCRRRGFWGTGVVPVGRGPAGYRQAKLPLPGPGKVHPIVTVVGSNGPRPRVLPGGPVAVGARLLAPLPPLGPGPGHGAPALGQALNRDFPVDLRTGRPVLGVDAAELAAGGPGQAGSAERVSVPAASGSGRSAGRPPGHGGGLPLNPAPPARPPAGSVPARSMPQPVRAPPVAPAPLRAAPTAPAPVHAAPSPVPVHSDAPVAKPKG